MKRSAWYCLAVFALTLSLLPTLTGCTLSDIINATPINLPFQIP